MGVGGFVNLERFVEGVVGEGGGGGLSKSNKCKQGGMGVPNFGHFVIT